MDKFDSLSDKSKNKQQIEKGFRLWLQRNKIFFETIAATFLTIMAVIISIVQINISIKQTKLLEIQTEISRIEFEGIIKKEKFQKSANWGELRNTMWEIFDLLSAPGGINSLEKLSVKEKIAWKYKVRKLLDSQIDNPVLLENKTSLGYWRNAISTAKIIQYAPETFIEQRFIIEAKSILKDISYVWKKLVLDSDEISATGGRPVELK